MLDSKHSNLQLPLSRFSFKLKNDNKTPNNYPKENDIASIAINFPRCKLGVISAKIVQPRGAKNPIIKDDIYDNR